MESPQVSQSFKTLELSENKLDIVQKEIAESSEPQLVLKPRLVGICRSDIKEFLGTRTVRHDFGHEILAEVVESNTNDGQVPKVGDVVVLDPHIKIQRTSGFGELIVATGSNENLTKAFIKVSPSISEDRLVFTEPLACAHHCVSNLLRYEQRKTLNGLSVGIVGAGMTGALIGLICKHLGAAITIINRSEDRLRFLENTSVYDASELSLMDDVEQDFDIVIPTTTFLFPDVLRFCEDIVKDSGLVLLYGGTKAGDIFLEHKELDIDNIRRSQSLVEVSSDGKRFRVGGTHGAITEDFLSVGKLLRDHPQDFPVDRLISNRIKLADVPETIIEMAEKENFGKTIVNFENESL